MSATSGFTSASQFQAVCQTSAFIGSPAARDSRHGKIALGGFADDLASYMQVPVAPYYSMPIQLTSVVTEIGIGIGNGYAAPAGQGESADSMMRLLQGLESEIAQLSDELGRASQQGCVASIHAPASGLRGDYQTLYREAVSAVQSAGAFDVKLQSGETLSGSFSWGELEPAGDNALFTPGDAGAPDAGKQAFDQAIEQFLALAQSDSCRSSANGQIANYNTATSFAGNNTALSWSASFSLAPADAMPKS